MPYTTRVLIDNSKEPKYKYMYYLRRGGNRQTARGGRYTNPHWTSELGEGLCKTVDNYELIMMKILTKIRNELDTVRKIIQNESISIKIAQSTYLLDKEPKKLKSIKCVFVATPLDHFAPFQNFAQFLFSF